MYSLSKQQKLIYDMEKFAGGSISNLCGSMIIKGKESEKNIAKAVNNVVETNDVLRTRIFEKNNQVFQDFECYKEQTFEIFYFDNKAQMDSFAEKFSKEPLNMYGKLYDIKIVILPDSYGVIVKMHHIISDAWSFSLFGTQINKFLKEEDVESFSYKKHIENEKKYLESKRYIKDKNYFVEQFKKCNEPTFLNEKDTSTLYADRKTFTVDKEKTCKLQDFAKLHDTSAFVLFTTALSVLFNRINLNKENFYLGTAVLNRTAYEDKQTMGMYINTVPMLMELNNNEDFLYNLKNVENTALSVLRHQRFNYDDVLKEIRKEYNFSGRLYDVIISYQNASIAGDNFETTWYSNGMQNESLQIHIDDRDKAGIYKIHYDYQIEKFTSHEIEMFHQHLMNILFDAVENVEKKIPELNILSESEKDILLYKFNDTKMDYDRNKCIHELFEEQVKNSPDKIALIACDGEFTYSQLNEKANRIANALIKRNIKPNDITAICLPRDSRLIAAMFGVLKAGAAYLPMDMDFPQDRIDYILSDSKAKIFIDENCVNELLNETNISNPKVEMSSENLCYCIYTSGSTGKPKGVQIRNRNAVNFLMENHNPFFHAMYNKCTSVLATNSVSFDIVTKDILFPLIHGMKIIFANEKEVSNIKLIVPKLPKEKVAFCITPTKLYMFLKSDDFKNAMKNFSVIMVGAEVFSPDLFRKIRSLSDATVFNGYGPTETTCAISYDEITSKDDITIGKPVANSQIYIVDKFMNPVPTGTAGELCIAGDNVGKGYLNKPELTDEKFIDNPFGEGKLYLTGDLAYWREDGRIGYIGRNDFQVKIRGLRVELGEIENAISRVKGVAQAVTVVRKNSEGRQLVCAFYTGKELDFAQIKEQISTHLPRYMIPHIITHLDAFPVTASGKVDRKALPEVDLNSVESSVEYVEPISKEELVLCNTIAELLEIERVGVLDNFLDLGGDSLKAIELIGKLDSNGYTTDLKTIFNCEDIKALAQSLVKSEEDVNMESFTGDIPASSAQLRIYTAQNKLLNSTMYNVPFVFKVEDKIDLQRLERALNELIMRHESLRTHFENKDGAIVQVIENDVHFELEKLDDSEIKDFIRPFDLSKAPLLRVGCYENIVMIDMHHIITDGGSMPVFIKELNELYMGRSLENDTVQYKAFTAKDNFRKADEDYWMSVFSDGTPEFEMNTDFKRKKEQSFNGSALYTTVSRELHDEILSKCKSLGITPFVFYIGAFSVLLSKFSTSEDVPIGFPVSGRPSKFLNTIGMFVNTNILRSKPEGEKTVTDFLNEIRTATIDIMEHQNYPYGELVKKLDIPSSNRNPIYDIMFAYQSEEMADIIFGDKKAEIMPIPITAAKYDITFDVLPREEDVVLCAEYCSDIYKEETMQRFSQGYKNILSQMLDDTLKIKDLTAVTKEDSQKLINEFNNTFVKYDKDKSLYSYFKEQVELKPEKTAVIFKGSRYTYKELDDLVNKYCASLQLMGVEKGSVVAVHIDRSYRLVAFQLAVLKVGGIFLPVDRRYPIERIEHMCNDCEVKLFISDELSQETVPAKLISLEDFENILPSMESKEIYNDSTCYIIYTSGSTGKPKGCMLTNKGLSNFCKNNNTLETLNTIENPVFASVNTVSFDYFIAESLLPVLNGFTTVILDDEESTIEEKFLSVAEKEKINVLMTTPTRLKIYYNGVSEESRVLEQLLCICTSGEPLTPELLETMYEKSPNAKVYNPIGPSECSVWDIGGELNREDGLDIHIGKPIANAQIYIVDKYMDLVPVGVTGEMCIAGDGVGAGYLNNPEFTKERFIDNPFNEGKLYKTGDLAYWREDGNIAYVGRNDFQVKIRGLRIELGEIENALVCVDGIEQSVAVVRRNSEGRQLICAFYTGEEKEIKEIRESIGKVLPKYMLPHIYTHVDSFPLTTSGKINRKALPKIDLENIVTDTEYVAPKTDLQKAVCKLEEDILQTTRIGLTDDFFDLGGDSLKAIELVSKAHSEGIYFELQNVFDYPTAEKLCECIENGDKQNFTFDKNDFIKADSVLAKNDTVPEVIPEKKELGNILLAGATGFLGIHILADFLEKDKGTAYCLVRGKNDEESENRLHSLLNFYFADKYTSNGRIKVISADLQKENLGLSDEVYSSLINDVDTVINTAASVKHYGSYKYFYDVNVKTVKRLIDFTRKANAKLIHVSTLSVSGNSFADEFDGYISDDVKHFYESSLYVGQPLDNVYARSKFEAEKAVLDAIADGLQANIMRMGNLTNRLSDGVFQKNYESNAFLKRMLAILELGMVPDYLMDLYTEFTPIDEAADAIMTIARHFNKDKTVFHINSIKVVYLNDMMKYMNELSFDFKVVSGSEFTQILRNTTKNTESEHIFETFINDMDKDEQLNYDSNIRLENDFTVEYLKKLGFEWSNIELEYIRKYVAYFRKIGAIK